MSNKKHAVLSLSGGMDSSTLLLHLLANNYYVTALSFDYGQKHKVELERATELVEYINNQRIDPINTRRYAVKKSREDMLWEFTTEENLEKIGMYPKVKHQIIKLDGLAQLLNSSLVEGGSDVPEGHYAEENMKDTVVPNRNKIFSSIIQAVALSIADKNNANCSIAMGIHAGDHAIYPDCRQEFRDIDFEAFKAGNWGSEKVNVYTPYLNGDKFDILKNGLQCTTELDLNFDEIYKRTNTSYKPIFIEGDFEDRVIKDTTSLPWKLGKWYSDYKSASSVERIEAFIKLGIQDPVEYADESGPVSWEVAKAHVETVLNNHNK
jgi:7-cyano-7-deazaguanine synthase